MRFGFGDHLIKCGRYVTADILQRFVRVNFASGDKQLLKI